MRSQSHGMWVAVLIGAVSVAACGQEQISATSSVGIASMELSPRDTIVIDTSRVRTRRLILTYRVRLVGADGRELPRTQFPVRFSSSLPFVAEVDQDGAVYSSSGGNVWIHARAGSGDRVVSDSALLQLGFPALLAR